MSFADFSGLTKKRPERALSKGKKRISGRNSAGRIAIRHRGGGHKRLHRMVDFRRIGKENVPGKVFSIEYDPNRTAYIMLIHYADGDKRYHIAAEGVVAGDTVVSGERTKVKPGNRMQLQHIPTGYKIYDVEINLGRGGEVVRSAGTSATLVGFDKDFAIIQFPSNEVRRVRKNCSATIGTVCNSEHSLVRIGKAGRKRWMGRRPQVLGKSMNAVDHPHGGGEGHSPIGSKKGPRTPWGKRALGVKTRKKNKASSKLIMRKRSRKGRKK
jgi:large subunit ribosomal protein L2